MISNPEHFRLNAQINPASRVCSHTVVFLGRKKTLCWEIFSHLTFSVM